MSTEADRKRIAALLDEFRDKRHQLDVADILLLLEQAREEERGRLRAALEVAGLAEIAARQERELRLSCEAALEREQTARHAAANVAQGKVARAEAARDQAEKSATSWEVVAERAERERDEARARLAEVERLARDALTAGRALRDSIGEYVRQAMHGNPEWSAGIHAIEVVLFSPLARSLLSSPPAAPEMVTLTREQAIEAVAAAGWEAQRQLIRDRDIRHRWGSSTEIARETYRGIAAEIIAGGEPDFCGTDAMTAVARALHLLPTEQKP